MTIATRPTSEDAMTKEELEKLYDLKTLIKLLERLIDNEIESLQENRGEPVSNAQYGASRPTARSGF